MQFQGSLSPWNKFPPTSGGSSSPQYLGGTYGPIARAVARAYNGGLGQSPQRGRGSDPLAGQRDRERSPLPEDEAFLVLGRSMKATNLPTFLKIWKRNQIYALSLQNSWVATGHKTGGTRSPPRGPELKPLLPLTQGEAPRMRHCRCRGDDMVRWYPLPRRLISQKPFLLLFLWAFASRFIWCRCPWSG